MTNAKVEYEYSVWNQLPVSGNAFIYDERLFDIPIRDFETEHAAKDYADSQNNIRDDVRKSGLTIDVDRIAGSPIEVVVRRRLVIKLDWENI